MSGTTVLRFCLISFSLIYFQVAENPCFAQQGVPDTTVTLQDTIVSDLEEVVITGTRVSRKIIDIPFPVVRLNNVAFRYDRRVGADDVLEAVPGLFLQSRYGNHDVRFAIRGFGSRSNSGIRGVRILLDDIPESEPDGQTRIEAIDFNSIGRIELVRGNASSLYTNAPGGVVNFINDLGFQRSSILQFNQFGSFGLQRNGIKAAVRTDNYKVLATYSRQKYDGYRAHNQEDWHILNLVVETKPGQNSSLKLLGYFVDGFIKLPGSLTKEEFENDPFQADQRSVDRDQKRISTKGRLGIRFNTKFGARLNNEIEVTGYATIKYFERTSREYRIINRYGLGLRASYINRSKLGSRKNELLVGTDLLLQPARTEFYDNIGGEKGDQLNQLTDETIRNTGIFISDQFDLVPDKLLLLLSARYDNVVFSLAEETLPSREDERRFHAITPKLALN
jgi:iron complex outermembrane receptor protein